MCKSKLQQAINSANSRFAKGLNDDDQVFKMCQIDSQTKGYTFRPTQSNTYELTTDAERLQELVDTYGYWSEPVKRFNSTLTNKGGHEYMQKLNGPYTGTGNGRIN